MRPQEKNPSNEQPIIGTGRLDLILNMDHELVKLADRIDWSDLVKAFGPLYSPDRGRPGIPIRTMAGLVMIQHTYALSDEEVLARWVENPYYQYFCGGHMKSDGKLGRNFLKGHIGDAINAVFCGVGHNLRKILGQLRITCSQIPCVTHCHC